MTQPTQAQKAAAKEAWRQAMLAEKSNDEAWVAALTAAAQVGDDRLIPSIIDAAQIEIAATIERCAQVAEADTVNNRIAGQRIADAIRKLKEEP